MVLWLSAVKHQILYNSMHGNVGGKRLLDDVTYRYTILSSGLIPMTIGNHDN